MPSSVGVPVYLSRFLDTFLDAYPAQHYPHRLALFTASASLGALTLYFLRHKLTPTPRMEAESESGRGKKGKKGRKAGATDSTQVQVEVQVSPEIPPPPQSPAQGMLLICQFIRTISPIISTTLQKKRMSNNPTPNPRSSSSSGVVKLREIFSSC